MSPLDAAQMMPEPLDRFLPCGVNFDLRLNLKHLFPPIEALSHKDLPGFLGSAEPFQLAASSLRKDFHDWKMEIDDSPIFRYIYRSVKPKRHLEFGTWMGTGTCYVLKESDATVWTINPPFGESLDDGQPAYGAYDDEVPEIQQWVERMGLRLGDSIRSDTKALIGRKYLAKDLGSRVCQIYCDSREWDTANYPDGFFDTILIDGGHTEDVVTSDTQKALPLLRSGGVIMWHDFCPNPEIIRDFATCRGVVNAVRAMADDLGELQSLRWIFPSFILLGIKK